MEHFTDFCHMTELGIEKKAAILAEALVPLVRDLRARKSRREVTMCAVPSPDVAPPAPWAQRPAE